MYEKKKKEYNETRIKKENEINSALVQTTQICKEYH